jgi:Reverse transcriptase (RNA-dependent DNA polymerase)
MPFGLSSAPRAFTKILKVVMAFLRKKGIRIIIYLDDILILNGPREGLLADLELVVELLHALGFIVNQDKSVFFPTQIIEYLGLVVSSIDSFALSATKAEAVKKMCKSALAEGMVSLRTLASIQGNFCYSGNPLRIIALP